MKKLLYLGVLLCLFLPRLGTAQSERNLPFSWDNLTVYFLITDRFNNGDTTNDSNFDRFQDSRNNELDFHGGDIAGVTQKLEEGYFDELGVSAIWVTPVVENRHGFNNPPANDPTFRDYPYHGYHTNDWTAFDPNFTSAEDFENFINTAHDHGIRVLLDIVMNHSGYRTFKNVNGQLEFVDDDYPSDWVRLQCGTENGELPCDDLTTPLFGLPDIRTESFNTVNLPQWLLDKWDAEGRKQQELDELDAYFSRTGKPRAPRYYLIKWLTDWVREYGIDGFRVDTERHVGVDAWAELKDEAVAALKEWKQNNPTKKLDDLDFYMTGEHSGVNIIGNVGDQLPDDFTVGKFNSMINFRSPKEAYTELGQEEIFSSFAAKLNDNDDGFGTPGEYNMISYLRSHDFSEFYTGNMFEGAVKLLLSPGGAQIYYGDESGRQFFDATTYVDAGYRSDMNWDSIDDAMLLHWRKLGKFRREHISIGGGSHQKLSDAPYIFKREYNRNGETDKALVFQGQDNDFVGALNVFGMWPEGTVLKDYFSDTTATVSGGTITFGTTFGIVLVGEPFDLSNSVTLSVDPVSGFYTDAVTVEMTASTTAEGAAVDIFYTTDGTDPSVSSIQYTTPFDVTTTTAIKAIAFDSEGNESSIIPRDYVIGDGSPFDVYFKKPASWSSANIYLFNQNTGDALPGLPAWPGAIMDTVEGTPWFTYNIDQDVQVGIVFNDNGGDQTDDLTRITEGWYDNQWFDSCPSDCPGLQLPVLTISPDSGAYNGSVEVSMSATNSGVIYYTLDGSTPDATSTLYAGTFTISSTGTTSFRAIAINSAGSSDIVNREYTIQDILGYTVNFRKPDSWNTAYVYLYDKNANAAIPGFPAWPGVQMSQLSTSPWFTYSIDESVEVGIVFNDNGGAQTDDLFRTTDGWYNNGWTNTCPGECPGIIPDSSFDIYFKKPSSWNTVFIYIYDKNANIPISGAPVWPGIEMNAINGSPWYSSKIDESVEVGIVFTDNGGAQTDDLFRTTEGWYDNQWFDSCPSDCPSINDIKASFFDKAPASDALQVARAWPNPFNESLTLSFTGNMKDNQVRIEMFDLAGKKANTTLVKDTRTNTITMNTSNLPKGIYLLKIVSDKNVKVMKMVK
ncbi:T9SS C-terminal target domain-containing protein [Aquimarina sp. BL5]|uniref:starch-binding protein n=1 Tax=Aquimarina sp. BL5 TaxID=1714860 RepID=UPI000E470BEB|nr:starch-binding protein [Aquimarina sp. BL5]AXT50286.1 T9SS C-terminal target domain-containing protein [Aquimarina sp. BL5]RKN07144.1 starch-binding protein [Aquimarina sp. BL5]